MFSVPIIPVQASTFAEQYDRLFYTILALTVFFTVVVLAAVLFLAVRYRRGSKVNRSNPPDGNLPLEITWSVIPLLLGLVIFFFGAKEFIYFKTPPKGGLQVYCVGKQWMWHFQHAENGIRENNTLHVPMGVPVTVTMISQDVIHALYIPEFRFQYQVIPGRYTQAWFQATKVGVYHIFCNMYCGVQHSEMGGYVYVMTPEDYAKWVANGGNDYQPMTMAQRGALIFKRNGCDNCHGATDTERAPSLYSLYGKLRKFNDGTSAVADEAYIKESILTPNAHIVQGYDNTMPSYQIPEVDMFDLVKYVEGLGSSKPMTPQTKIAVDKGAVPTNAYKGDPKFADGAIANQDPTQPKPSKGNLAVGALADTNREAGN